MTSCRRGASEVESTAEATTPPALAAAERPYVLGLPAGVTVGDEQAILQAAILCGGRQPLIDALHELAPRVLRECQQPVEARRRVGRPARRDRTAAEVLGIVMPGGPLCARDGADVAIKPAAQAASTSG